MTARQKSASMKHRWPSRSQVANVVAAAARMSLDYQKAGVAEACFCARNFHISTTEKLCEAKRK